MHFVTDTGNGEQCQQRGTAWYGVTQGECQRKTCEMEAFIMVYSEETCVSWRCQDLYWPPSNPAGATIGVFNSRSTITLTC